MNKLSNSFRWTLVNLVVLGFAMSARSQLTFSTLAGSPAGNSVDGIQDGARFSSPTGIATDSAGNIYVADTALNTIRKVTPAGFTTTLAGSAGVSGSADGTNSVARFNQPGGLAVDASGNVFVADTGNHTIRRITPAGVVTTWAGQAGVPGPIDQIGTNAQFFFPQAVVVDSSNYVYVADYGNNSIRKITPGRSVSTFAGLSGAVGTTDGNGITARFNQPSGIALDSAGNFYVSDNANGTIRKISPVATVSTLAGTPGNYGSGDGSGTNVQFYQPEAVAVDALGNVLVADYFNNTIRLINPSGVVSTLAGTAGRYGSADGINTNAQFWGPEGIAVDSNGHIYVADAGNGTIRKIVISGPDAVVTTLAGSASTGIADGTGNQSRFYWPGGIATDSSGAVYVADTENNTIRKLTAAGAVSTYAGAAGIAGSGDGTTNTARFWGPQGVATDASGNLYVADTANATIRKITPGGVVSTIAGSPGVTGSLDGTNSGALFYQPQGVAVDLSGNVYVADTWNHTIRLITPAGVVSTIAGLPGYFGNTDGTNSTVRFNSPAALVVDAATNVYVSDCFNHTIRKLTPQGPDWVSSTVAGLPGVWGSAEGSNTVARFYRPQGIALDNAGNLYVADTGNETTRKLTLSGTNWGVTTVAGLPGASGSTNGLGAAARFHSPAGIAISAAGSVYVADAVNNTIRLSGLNTNKNAPTIINQPVSQTLNPGSNATFTVTVNGNAPLAFQWRFNGTNIVGTTTSSYTRTNAQSGDAGNYSVVITNASGSVVSADAALFLNIKPFITVQPQQKVANLGESVTFDVVAGGSTPLNYQWRFQGTDIPGATDASFTLATTQITNAGAYSVAVNNVVGTTVSSNAFLFFRALFALGDNSFGQSAPPASAVNMIAVAAGAWHSLGLRVDGQIIGWGNDVNGQCDPPANLGNVLAIAAGGYHSAAISEDGSLSVWGANDYGQTNVPAGLSNILAVACGTWHTVALRRDGTVVAWGDNTRDQTNVPTGLSNVISIAAGGNHSLALKADGTVVAWGENDGANATFTGQSVVPDGLAGVVGIAAGDYHSLAVKSDGTVVAWGDNAQGQCSVPGGITNAVALAGGATHTLCLLANGMVLAWGGDSSGQSDLDPNLTGVVGLGAGAAHSVILVESVIPNPLLLNVGRSGNQFSALLQTLNRTHYALDYATSLSSSNWTGIVTNSGNGALELLMDPSAVPPQRFYRMRQW